MKKINDRFPIFRSDSNASLLTLNCQLPLCKKTKIFLEPFCVEMAIFFPGTFVEPNSFGNLLGFPSNGRLKFNELSTHVVIERKHSFAFNMVFVVQTRTILNVFGALVLRVFRVAPNKLKTPRRHGFVFVLCG